MLFSTPGAAGAAEDEVKGLLVRARGGDESAVPALRLALDANPALWRAYGDLGFHCRQAWIALIAGGDMALRESLTRKTTEMEAELTGPGAQPLEWLLGDRVVACWLQLQYADTIAAQSAGVSLRQASFAIKRQESAHRRFLTAIGSLATVRRLLTAAVEIGAAKPVTALPGPTSSAGPDGVDGGGEAAVAAGDDPAGAVQLIPFETDGSSVSRRRRSPRVRKA